MDHNVCRAQSPSPMQPSTGRARRLENCTPHPAVRLQAKSERRAAAFPSHGVEGGAVLRSDSPRPCHPCNLAAWTRAVRWEISVDSPEPREGRTATPLFPAFNFSWAGRHHRLRKPAGAPARSTPHRRYPRGGADHSTYVACRPFLDFGAWAAIEGRLCTGPRRVSVPSTEATPFPRGVRSFAHFRSNDCQYNKSYGRPLGRQNSDPAAEPVAGLHSFVYNLRLPSKRWVGRRAPAPVRLLGLTRPSPDPTLSRP